MPKFRLHIPHETHVDHGGVFDSVIYLIANNKKDIEEIVDQTVDLEGYSITDLEEDSHISLIDVDITELKGVHHFVDMLYNPEYMKELNGEDEEEEDDEI